MCWIKSDEFIWLFLFCLMCLIVLVHFIWKKLENRPFIDSALYNPVRFIVRKIRYMITDQEFVKISLPDFWRAPITIGEVTLSILVWWLLLRILFLLGGKVHTKFHSLTVNSDGNSIWSTYEPKDVKVTQTFSGKVVITLTFPISDTPDLWCFTTPQ